MSLMNLFNGGGSVRSRRSSSPGPKTREKLQPRSTGALLNSIQNRQNREQRRWEKAGGQGPYPVLNQPNPDDRRHSLDTMSPGWQEASLNPEYSEGVIGASNGKSWLSENPWFVSLMANRHGDSQTLQALENMGIGGGGLSAFGGTFSPTIERGDDGWNVGFTGKWSLGG